MALHTRNVLVAAAQEAARYGANADRGPEQARLRAREVVSDALSPRVAARLDEITARVVVVDGLRTMEVTLSGPLPLVLLPAGPLRRHRPRARRGGGVSRPRGDAGNALVEFTYLAVLLMIPLVYILLSTFQVQRAAFGVTEAARQAGRAYATAPDQVTARQRAEVAVRLALKDQGLACVDCLRDVSGVLAPGGQVSVTVRYRVALPVLGAFFRGHTPPNIPVTASHVEVVDRFRTTS